MTVAVLLLGMLVLSFMHHYRCFGTPWLVGLAGVYVCAALGTLLLGRRMLRLTKAIQQTRDCLLACETEIFIPPGSAGIDVLTDAIHKVFQASSNTLHRLQAEVEDLRLRAQLLEQQKRNVEAIVHSLHDPVFVVDELDGVIMANKSAGRLFAFDCHFDGHKLIDELVGEEASELVTFMRQTRASKVEAARRQISFADLERPWVFDCIVSCVSDDTDKVCGTAVVLHDVTREREISQIKNDFVGYVSHELKTPLASITAYAEMLIDDEADDEAMRKEFYSVIQGQATRLNRLIETILNISRIESGLFKINKQPVSLAVLVEEQLQMIRSYAEDRHVRIIGHTGIIFDQVNADRDMMSQVIVNLLSNAIKYNHPGGSVRVSIDVDEAQSLVRVKVEDTGVGIPPEDLEKVFDKFYRSSLNENKVEGSGLGLNLVKQIVEKLHGGRVFAQSQIGSGSVFGFELPLAVKHDLKKSYSVLQD
jgi:two-component system, OmpR family, phosphate regulon sensor histidine kinase PhoR